MIVQDICLKKCLIQNNKRINTMKDCEKFGCKYTSKEDKEFKIIQEYYDLLQKDWVQQLCDRYGPNSQVPQFSHVPQLGNTKNIISKMVIINDKWYYKKDENQLNLITAKEQVLYESDGTIHNIVRLNTHNLNIPIKNIIYIYAWEKSIIDNSLNDIRYYNNLNDNYIYEGEFKDGFPSKI